MLYTPETQIISTNLSNATPFKAIYNAKFASAFAPYTDPIRAVIREYATNAWDSHIRAGKADQPFRVSLPTALAPFFVVEDFGVGLTGDEARHYFATIGASQGENEANTAGYWGWGSAAWMGYATKTAFFEFRKNGVLVSAVAALDENGLPTWRETDPTPSDKPDGVTVRIPVNNKDFAAFNTKAQEVLKWFNPAPEGALCEREIPVLSSELWEMYEYPSERTRRRPHDEAIILMANVVYNVPYTAVNFKELSSHEVNYWLTSAHLVLKAPIGAVDITPSREGAKQSDKTRAFVLQALTAFKDEYALRVQEALDKCETLYEARCLNKKFGSGWYRNAMPDTTGIKYRGRSLSFDHEVKGYFIKANDSARRGAATHHNRIFLERAAIEWKGNEDVYLIDEKPRALLAKVESCPRHGRDAIFVFDEAGIEALGNPPYRLLSSVEWDDEPVTRRNNTAIKKWWGTRWNDHNWQPRDVTIFVDLFNGATEVDVAQINSLLIDTQAIPESLSVFGIPATCASIKKKPGFIELRTWVKEEIIKPRYHEVTRMVSNYLHYEWMHQNTIVLAGIQTQNETYAAFVKGLEELRESYDFKTIQKWLAIFKLIELDFSDVGAQPNLFAVRQTIQERWPLMTSLKRYLDNEWGNSNTLCEDLAAYLER